MTNMVLSQLLVHKEIPGNINIWVLLAKYFAKHLNWAGNEMTSNKRTFDIDPNMQSEKIFFVP